MDYNGTNSELYKYQWDYIHNPQEGIVRWLVDDEEGDSFLDGDFFVNRSIIESLRFSYAFGRDFLCEPRKSGISKNIVLGNGIKYDYLVTSIQSKHQQNLNLKTCEMSKPFIALDDTKLRSGFGLLDHGQTRQVYAVEYETTKEQHESIRKYILCPDAANWGEGIDFMIKNRYWSNLSALPDDAFGVITNNQRINILSGVCASNINADCARLILLVAKNVNTENVATFFDALEKTDILFKLKNKLKSSEYEDFIKYLTLAYFSQSDIKERVANMQHVYTWHRGIDFTGAGDEITFVLSQRENRLHIKSTVKKWTLQGQAPIYQGEVTLVNEDISMTELIGVYMSEGNLCNLKADNQIYPMPAFFFDYLISKQNKDDLLEAIDALTTIASFVIGVGELKTATQVGAKFILTSISTLRLLTEPTITYINNQKGRDDKNWERFYLMWETLWTVLDITNLRQADILKHKDQITALCAAWETYSTANLLSEEDKKIDDFIKSLNEIANEK